jgi:hypothetical protein
MVLFFYFAHFLSTDKTNVDLLPMGPGLELLVLGPIEKNQVPVYPLQERTQHFYFLQAPGLELLVLGQLKKKQVLVYPRQRTHSRAYKKRLIAGRRPPHNQLVCVCVCVCVCGPP